MVCFGGFFIFVFCVVETPSVLGDVLPSHRPVRHRHVLPHPYVLGYNCLRIQPKLEPVHFSLQGVSLKKQLNLPGIFKECFWF